MTSRQDIEFMFSHFMCQPYAFPRRIATFKSSASGKIKSGGQFPVNTIDEIIAAYKRADDKDCRLNAYPFDQSEQLRILPDVIFIDIDNLEQSELNKVLRRMKKLLITSCPTVINSGRGYHVIQPVDCLSLENMPIPKWFAEAEQNGWTGFYRGLESEVLGFSEEHLSQKIADESHSPSIRSCMLRPPGTINAKASKEVTIVQCWDGKRPSIELLLGDFFSDRLQKYNEQRNAENERLAKAAKGIASLQMTDDYYDYYIPIILKTPLPDWREHIVALEIVPYLLTIKQMPEEQVYQITENWLKACDQLKPLVWDYSDIWKKIRYTRAGKRKPMGKARLLYEMSTDAPEAYLILQAKLNLRDYSQYKGGEIKGNGEMQKL